MRIFHEQVFEEWVEGAGYFSAHRSEWGHLLLLADSLVFTVIVTSVTGTLPTFGLALLEGVDGVASSLAKTLISNVPLSLTC